MTCIYFDLRGRIFKFLYYFIEIQLNIEKEHKYIMIQMEFHTKLKRIFDQYQQLNSTLQLNGVV